MREVTTSLLRCGACRHPQAMTIKGGALRPTSYPALPMLIRHPTEGPILFDTGYDPAFFSATDPLPERAYRWLTPVQFDASEAAVQHLDRMGIAPEDVRHVVLSHFHGDHIAGLPAFRHARIHCARAGYTAACAGGRITAIRQGVLRSLIPVGFADRAVFFEERPRVPLPRSLTPFADAADLLGDGSLLAVELPGHCPGHWGLLINDAAYGLHFLIADAAWSLDAVRRNRPPPAITSGFLGDTRRTRETLSKLHALWRANPDIRLTPYHCPERASEALCAPSS